MKNARLLRVCRLCNLLDCVWERGVYSRLALNVNLYTRINVFLLLIAADACEADVLTSACLAGAVAVFFGDANVLTVAFVATGRAGL